MDVLKQSWECPREAVGVVADLAGAALAAGVTAAETLDDIEHVIEALHLLRPDNAEFAFFDGWLLMQRQNWEEAEWLFSDLVARSIGLPSSRGMLLQCLKARGAFGWQDEARELVDQHGAGELGRLARTLLAADDLQRAKLDASRTGRFVAPESALALEQDSEAAHTSESPAQAPGSMAHELPLALQYMRI